MSRTPGPVAAVRSPLATGRKQDYEEAMLRLIRSKRSGSRIVCETLSLGAGHVPDEIDRDLRRQGSMAHGLE